MFHTWFRPIAGGNRPVETTRRFRPWLEPLEDRRLLSFLPAVNYPDGTGTPAGFVAVADLTGDGIPDIVTTEGFGDYRLSVFLGNGDGTFQPAVNYLSGDGPVGVRVADLNGDGIPDIITNNGVGTVSVLRGNGDGTFQHKRDFFAGAATDDLVVADLNGDGVPDIATANQNAGTVSVLLGNGAGSFQPLAIYPAGVRPIHIAAGRFGSDSDLPDLAVVNVQSGTAFGSVSVLVNHGDGTFRRPVAYQVGAFPLGLALGDFANTGTPDIAVADFQSNTVSILTGNGDHTFRPARSISVPGGPNSLEAADLNNDGNLDLAVTLAAASGGDRVGVLLGDGTGSFARPVNVPTDRDPQGIVAVDLNHDGLADLVTANVLGRSVTVLLNDGAWETVPRGHQTSADMVSRISPVRALAPLAVSPGERERDTPRAFMVSSDEPLDTPTLTPSGGVPAAPRPWTAAEPALRSSVFPGGAPRVRKASDLLEPDSGALDRPFHDPVGGVRSVAAGLGPGEFVAGFGVDERVLSRP